MLALAAALVLQPIASEPTQLEVDTLEVCIANAPHRGVLDRCMGTVSEPCLNTQEGMTTAGSIACVARELSIWDNQLNLAYRDMQQNLVGTDWDNRATRLQDAQRAWITYRDLECDQQSLMFEGGSLARVIRISCLMELTAARAVDLRGQVLETQR